jgi:integrase
MVEALSPAAVRVLEGQARTQISGNALSSRAALWGAAAPGASEAVGEGEEGGRFTAADLRIHDLRHSLASALANAGTPLYQIGAVLDHRQLSTTTRYAHHSPQRMIETVTVAEGTWNLLPAPEGVED